MRVAIGIALFAGTLGVSVVAQTSNFPSCVYQDCNCADFKTWQEAQRVFEAYQNVYPDRRDPFGLDLDRDNVACENLLGASFDNTATSATYRPGNTNTPPSQEVPSNVPTDAAPIRALW